MDAQQDLKRVLSSAVCSAACFAGKTRDFSVDVAKVSMKFGAHFARDTRPSNAETKQKSQEGAAWSAKEMDCVCGPLPLVARSFDAKTAQFCGRNSRDFARKILKISRSAATDARTRHT